jgi:arginyl-tRNA--protein-N-Asp/Glu arginylyltransferase
MKESVRLRQYIVTLHAVEEMDDDGFSIFDVEHCILRGVITERQKEQKSAEWKYLVRGLTFNERGICVVAKMSISGKLVIITVYALLSKGERL